MELVNKELESKQQLLAESAKRIDTMTTEEQKQYEKILEHFSEEIVKEQESYLQRKSSLEEEIAEYQEHMNKIIEQKKKDEELKEKQDYYKLKLTEEDLYDIDLLLSLKTKLNNFAIIGKVIWSGVVQKPFQTLTAKLGTKEEAGIYKITCTTTDKVYIG